MKQFAWDYLKGFKEGAFRTKRMLFIAALVVGLHVYFFVLLQWSPLPKDKHLREGLSLSYRSTLKDRNQRIFDEQSAIFDTKPLYLTSIWSYSGDGLRAILNTEASSTAFGTIKPQLFLSKAHLWPKRYERTWYQTPTNALDWDYWSFLKTFATKEKRPKPSTGRAGVVEVKNMYSGAPVIHKDILLDNDQWGAGLQVPSVIFLQYKDLDHGPIAFPLLVRSSEAEEIDQAFKDRVRAPLFTDTLAPGYYLIEFGY